MRPDKLVTQIKPAGRLERLKRMAGLDHRQSASHPPDVTSRPGPASRTNRPAVGAQRRERPARSWRSPERIHALLIDCLAGRALAADRELSTLGLWDRAACAACEARVGGALDEALARQRVSPPPSAKRILDGYRASVAARNAYQITRMRPVFRELGAAGVECLLLKGAALNLTLYAAPGVRDMSDIDLLIRPGDLEAADGALRAAGCRRGAEPVRADFFPRFYYEREYLTGDQPSVRIDLHVRPFRPLWYAATVPDHALWDGSVCVDFGGASLRVPGPADTFLHLCVHAACHGCTQLRWMWDIVLFMDRYRDAADWDAWVRRADDWGVRYAVYRTLRSLRRSFGDTVRLSARGPGVTAPEDRLQNVTPDDPCEGVLDLAAIAERFRCHPTPGEWWAITQAPRDADHPTAHVLTNLLSLSGWRNRLSYLAAVALPDRSHMAHWYPRRHRGWLAVAHLARLMRMRGPQVDG
ncbi:MAG: hypothetical protein C4547_03625 [Phycisphaerales bacterium]|nr:MAG: hypothetical protein C4547_03625 [Phycisphaerales bacterium]